MTPARRLSATVRTGFTLIELIVVIAIIGILAAISLLVGGRVIDSGRIDMTKSLLRVLDSTQDSYFTDRDAKVPYKWADQSQKNEFAIADAKLNPAGNLDRVEPSTTFYLLTTNEAPSVQSAMGGFDTRYIVHAPLSNGPPANTNFDDFTTIYTRSAVNPQSSAGGGTVYGLVIKDPWGHAIRFVHPKFQGGYGMFSASGNPPTLPTGRDASLSVALKQGGVETQIRFVRSFRPTATDPGDADEGLCTGGRGYFYSPGKDGDPGTRIDNVYLDPPQFPTETAKLN